MYYVYLSDYEHSRLQEYETRDAAIEFIEDVLLHDNSITLENFTVIEGRVRQLKPVDRVRSVEFV